MGVTLSFDEPVEEAEPDGLHAAVSAATASSDATVLSGTFMFILAVILRAVINETGVRSRAEGRSVGFRSGRERSV